MYAHNQDYDAMKDKLNYQLLKIVDDKKRTSEYIDNKQISSHINFS